MGVWGSGLYSGDFAMDLRSDIKAVSRLPFDGDKLTELLCSLEPTAANNSDDEDHTTFWLVVADQFTKIGIVCRRVRARALQIIDTGSDIAMLAKLGMDSASLTKRQKMLAELREFLTSAPTPAKARSVLKRPQALLMEVGDVMVYPTSRGRCKKHCPQGVLPIPPWEQDGWGAAIVVSAGLAFDFLAWYVPLTLAAPESERPDLARLRSPSPWVLKAPGTCTPAEMKRLALETIGNLLVDNEKLKRAFPAMAPGTSAAIRNRSLERELNVGPQLPETYISVPANLRMPEGGTLLAERIRNAQEMQERVRSAQERGASGFRRRERTIASLDDILA